jgi:hypothetical protein
MKFMGIWLENGNRSFREEVVESREPLVHTISVKTFNLI